MPLTHGILLLDKPQGLSSNAAVQRVRRAFGRIKAGHTGSLDPLATGMLPICLGEATKVAGFLLDGDKEYRFRARFGARTATGDLEGEIVETLAVPGHLEQALRTALPAFMGEIKQVPPMYSALKRDGKPLYRLARQGVTVDRAPRSVFIRKLELESVEGSEATFHVLCGKGTYVRTLAEDLARAVGSCAHLVMLRRLSVAPFRESDMVSLEQVETGPGEVRLLPADAALLHLPEIRLQEGPARRLAQGQSVEVPGGIEPPGETLIRLYGPESGLLGLGQIEGAGRVKPVRIFNHLGAFST